jgi:hypothetical protein
MSAKKNTKTKATKNAKADTAKMKKSKMPKDKKLSAIDAAAQVLATAKAPMNSKEMIEAMATKALWTSPGGKTPHATLYSAIIREIALKGKEARFVKKERGKFAAKQAEERHVVAPDARRRASFTLAAGEGGVGGGRQCGEPVRRWSERRVIALAAWITSPITESFARFGAATP